MLSHRHIIGWWARYSRKSCRKADIGDRETQPDPLCLWKKMVTKFRGRAPLKAKRNPSELQIHTCRFGFSRDNSSEIHLFQDLPTQQNYDICQRGEPACLLFQSSSSWEPLPDKAQAPRARLEVGVSTAFTTNVSLCCFDIACSLYLKNSFLMF